MPYIGLLPFLLVYEDCEFPVKESVSMPYIGLLPFLRGNSIKNKCGMYRVNALYRASPISTYILEYISNDHKSCVNALYRASPISTKVKKMTKIEKIVSMPYIGLLPFLLTYLKS